MPEVLEISINHQGFFLQNQPFVPNFKEGEGNVMLIPLSSSLTEDLDWKEAGVLANIAASENKLIFWQFDFGIQNLASLNEAHFLSFSIAIDHFKDTLWKEHKERTLGLTIYNGKMPKFSGYQEQYEEWFQDHFGPSQEEPRHERLFHATMLAEYLHRLASCFPVEANPFCFIDASDIESPAEAAQLFSPERFAHLHLGIKGCPLPLGILQWKEGNWMQIKKEATLGVVLPSDELCSSETLHLLDNLFKELEKDKLFFRIIPESLLTEQWDGLDNLLVLPSALSSRGKRMLQGFSAAGGAIISCGAKLGFAMEFLFEEWVKNNRSRGI